jgi:iron(III) transport system ATP-binding protein
VTRSSPSGRSGTPSKLSAAPAVELDSIAKKFASVVAIGAVSLSVADGEFVCFLGPSGCGKTTLLRIIAGLERQNGGVVRMRGRDVSALPPSRRNYGIVFQSYALFPNLTVGRNIAYGLETRGKDRASIDERVTELLALISLPGYRERYPNQLSGGEQQRVALARALAPSPSLLLLDEPLSALDARVRLALRGEIKGLQRRLGITTIMVTHDQEEALAMADRIVVMNHGGVEQIGTPSEIYMDPHTQFVARFVGQMNFLPARADDRPGWARVGSIALQHRAAAAIPAGTALTLAIRPEELVIGAAARQAPNSLTVKVAAVQFLGAFTRLALAIPGHDDAHVECDVAAGALADVGAKEGGEISIALPSSALRVFR